MMAMVQIPEQRFQAWSERAARLQPNRQVCDRPLATSHAPRGVAPALDDHRPQLGELDHLAASDSPLAGLRQGRATPATGRWPTAHHKVWHRPAAADPQMAAFRSPLLPPPLRAIPLESL